MATKQFNKMIGTTTTPQTARLLNQFTAEKGIEAPVAAIEKPKLENLRNSVDIGHNPSIQ